MDDEYGWSDPANELFAALAKAQLNIKNAIKESNNPHFNRTYADLASVKEACLGALNAEGISVTQMPINGVGNSVGVVTLFGHSSGQWISSRMCVTPMKLDPQSVGSAVSYCRRYSLAAMAGVASVDDDGEQATDHAPPRQPVSVAARQPAMSRLEQVESVLASRTPTAEIAAQRPLPTLATIAQVEAVADGRIADFNEPTAAAPPEEPPPYVGDDPFWSRRSYMVIVPMLSGGKYRDWKAYADEMAGLIDRAPEAAVLAKLMADNQDNLKTFRSSATQLATEIKAVYTSRAAQLAASP